MDDLLCRYWNASTAVQPDSKPGCAVQYGRLVVLPVEGATWRYVRRTSTMFHVPLLLLGQNRHVGHPRRGRISEVDECADTEVLPGHR